MSSEPITQKDLDDAKAKAAESGVPEPVKDKSGKILYYVDLRGAVVPKTIAEEQRQVAGVDADPTDTRGVLDSKGGLVHHDSRVDMQAANVQIRSGATLKQQASERTAAQSAIDSGVASGFVWVNGQRRQVVNGALVYDNSAVGDDGKPTNKLSQNSTVFNALNLTDIPNSSAAFLMSISPTDIFTGTDPAGGYRPATGDHSAAANTVQNGHQMMSISNGLEWLANLAAKDAPTYTEIVKHLKDANYIPDTTNDQVFNADAAHGFALATRDLAIVNSRAGGENVTLDQFLGQAQQAKADARAKGAASYQGVDRSYTDPESLKQTLKAAAQDALGRALTDEEEAKFLSAFRGKESAMYDTLDTAGRAQAGAAAVGEGAPGATVTRPDASGQAEGFLDSPEFEQEKFGTALGKYGQILQSMVGLSS